MTKLSLIQVAQTVDLPDWATHVAISRVEGERAEPCMWDEKQTSFVDGDIVHVAGFKHPTLYINAYWHFLPRVEFEPKKKLKYKSEACWRVELTTVCPHCHESLDLLDDPEFLSYTEIEIAEHGTERTRNVEATCSECGEEFTTTLVY